MPTAYQGLDGHADSGGSSIAWEGMQETHYSQDTFAEKAVSLNKVVEHTARDLISRLP